MKASTPRAVQLWRNASLRKKLDELIGEDSEQALRAVMDIAEGKGLDFPSEHQIGLLAIMPKTMRANYLKSFAPPSWHDRLQAWALILAYHQGRPAQSVEITAEVADPAPPVDYSKLSDAELKQFHELLSKASTEATRVVEGTVTRYGDESLTGEGDSDTGPS